MEWSILSRQVVSFFLWLLMIKFTIQKFQGATTETVIICNYAPGGNDRGVYGLLKVSYQIILFLSSCGCEW